MKTVSLAEFVSSIDAFNANRPDMVPVRAFNHDMVRILDEMRPVAGRTLLDIGASAHGYALEEALRRGAGSYLGIGLGVWDEIGVRDGERTGSLVKMDATALTMPDASVDLALALNTFEHFADGAGVLRELFRVLVPGGAALVSFQPIWTSSYGHHLHHRPEIARLIPPWAHLVWSEPALRRKLAPALPPGAEMTLDEIAHWIYHDTEINRVDVVTLRAILERSPLEVEWLTPLSDDVSGSLPMIAEYVSRTLPYTADELMTIGFSAMLRRPMDGKPRREPATPSKRSLARRVAGRILRTLGLR